MNTFESSSAAAAAEAKPQPTPFPAQFVMQQPAKPVCNCKGLKKPRQLHALVGFFLIAFLIAHLAIIATGVKPALYQATVDRVEALTGGVPVLLFLFLFLPLLVQFGSGLFLVNNHGLRYDVKSCNRGGKLRFYLQRTSAVVFLVFLLVHVATLHAWGLHLVYRLFHPSWLSRYAEGGLFHPKGDAFQSTITGITQAWTPGSVWQPGNLALLGVTIIGLLAALFHVTNGMWTGGLILKIATKDQRRVLWGSVCVLVGAVVLVLAVISLYTVLAAA